MQSEGSRARHLLQFYEHVPASARMLLVDAVAATLNDGELYSGHVWQAADLAQALIRRGVTSLREPLLAAAVREELGDSSPTLAGYLLAAGGAPAIRRLAEAVAPTLLADPLGLRYRYWPTNLDDLAEAPDVNIRQVLAKALASERTAAQPDAPALSPAAGDYLETWAAELDRAPTPPRDFPPRPVPTYAAIREQIDAKVAAAPVPYGAYAVPPPLTRDVPRDVLDRLREDLRVSTNVYEQAALLSVFRRSWAYGFDEQLLGYAQRRPPPATDCLPSAAAKPYPRCSIPASGA